MYGSTLLLPITNGMGGTSPGGSQDEDHLDMKDIQKMVGVIQRYNSKRLECGMRVSANRTTHQKHQFIVEDSENI